MILVPALLFAVLEVSLRVGCYGDATAFFLDGSTVEGRDVWIDNNRYDRWVFPAEMAGSSWPTHFAIAKRKPADTFRIFVLGESAAWGFPEPSASFARVLEVMLRAQYPETRFEVVNTSMVAINSHVILPIARECLRHEPDLLIVHVGNNEVVGPFGAAGVLGPFSPRSALIRANLAIKTTRTGQLLNRVLGRLGRAQQAPQVWEGMTTFVHSEIGAGDERLRQIYAHHRHNLEAICDDAEKAGVGVIVCTIPVNLKDSAPFRSLHAADLESEQVKAWDKAYQEGVRLEEKRRFAEALDRYEAAATIDDEYADLAYRRGRCLLTLGKTSAAREQFVRARDRDALRFRSDTAINETIRAVADARAGAGVQLADAERAFEKSSPGGIPGEELFLEHVHMNFHGNYVLARTVFESIHELAPPGLGSGGGKTSPLAEEECAARLGHTPWNEHETAAAIYKMLTIQQPFTFQLDRVERARRWKAKLDALKARVKTEGLQSIAAALTKAMQSAEEDWMIPMNYGDFLVEFKSLEEAEKQYLTSLTRLRHCFATRCKLGNLHLQQGHIEEALGQFREAQRQEPDYLLVDVGIAQALAAQGKTAEALAILEERARKGPNRFMATVHLGERLDKAGKPAEAEQRWHEAQQMAPNSLVPLFRLAELADKQGRLDEAIEYYETALRVWPEWPEVRERLAEMRKKKEGAKGKGSR
jgi:tetratricopeptide (TPR) repeat protein